jgi:hypothetical protein
MRVLAFDCLIREEERTTWSEMREEAAVSFVEAFRAGDSIPFVFYLSSLSAVDGESQSFPPTNFAACPWRARADGSGSLARIAEDEEFRASIQDY